MGLLIGIECSRIRDSSWMYLTPLVTTRLGVELAAVQRKLSDYVVVGLQLYSARTFHVTLSPRIYKGGQGPPPNHHQHLSNTNNHTGRRVLRNSRPEPIKIFVFLAPSSSRAVDPYLQILLLSVSLSRLGDKHRQPSRRLFLFQFEK